MRTRCCQHRITIINEGNRAQSVFGNYSVAILKVSGNYKELQAGQAGLEDICSAAKDMEVVTVEDQVHRIQFT